MDTVICPGTATEGEVMGKVIRVCTFCERTFVGHTKFVPRHYKSTEYIASLSKGSKSS